MSPRTGAAADAFTRSTTPMARTRGSTRPHLDHDTPTAIETQREHHDPVRTRHHGRSVDSGLEAVQSLTLDGTLATEESLAVAIEQRVHELVVELDLRDFTDICRHARGAFPSDVLRAMTKVGIRPIYRSHHESDDQLRRVPDPSPVRGDWYFDRDSAANIAKVLPGQVLVAKP